VPFAAGIACIEKMKRLDLPKLLHEKGLKLREGLIAAARKHGYDLRVTGMPALFYLRLADEDAGDAGKPLTPTLMLHQRWIAEMVKRGIYLTNHHNHFLNYALSGSDIDTTLAVADEAFAAL
jgi:glutamate-1-semialdehyde 2,1-aminomutase